MVELMLHLQVHGRLGAAELASRLEVSERTVARDVASLVAAGVPLTSIRGPYGGYRLEGGYRTRLTGVADEEAGALTFLGLGGAAAELGLDDTLGRARTKVLAALTGPARERAQRSAERFHLDPVRWYGTPEPVPHLRELAAAVWADRRVELTYARDGREVLRVVDPLGLVLAAGDWYLVCHRDGSRRTYRVSRVREVRLLEDHVRRPVGFALQADWAAARHDLERRHELVEVRLRCDPTVLPRLRRVVAVSGQDRVDPSVVGEPVELTVPFEGASWALTCLLGLGGAVEVLGPPALRARVAEQTRAAAAHYR